MKKTEDFIHSWLYEVVYEICYDRDYIYYCFFNAFKGLMSDIFSEGCSEQRGIYYIEGMKSGYRAEISWELLHRIDYLGYNRIELSCKIKDRVEKTLINEKKMFFELSSGERL